MAEYKDELLDHEYDGIQELDNDLPRWWLYLFYFTIIWGVAYLLYFHVFHIGYLQEDMYKSEMDPNYVRVNQSDYRLFGIIPEYHPPYYSPQGDATPRRQLMAEGKESRPVLLTYETDTTTYAAVTDPALLAEGKSIFMTKCAQCHGKFGEGGVGPNLTDRYWLHDPSMSGIVKTVTYGFPAKGMISWRGELKPDEIIHVASYVKTLMGTNPPNPKKPQGELVEE